MADSRPTRFRFLVTAGPCQEPLDPVRYIGNRSSGKMGIAIADQARLMGHDVTLLLGPTHLVPSHPGIKVQRFRTTADLEQLLNAEFSACDVLVMATAVADYRLPPHPHNGSRDGPRDQRHDGHTGKIVRSASQLTLTLEPTPDLVAGCASKSQSHQTIVAFALEHEDQLGERAQQKLIKKNVDLIVANPLQTLDNAAVNATLFGRVGSSHEHGTAAPLGLAKPDFAAWLLAQIASVHPMTESQNYVKNTNRAIR